MIKKYKKYGVYFFNMSETFRFANNTEWEGNRCKEDPVFDRNKGKL